MNLGETSEMLVSDPQWRACGRGKTIEVTHGLESSSIPTEYLRKGGCDTCRRAGLESLATPTEYLQTGGCDTCRRAGSWPVINSQISNSVLYIFHMYTVAWWSSEFSHKNKVTVHPGMNPM